MKIHTYGGVALVPPATSIAEAEQRWRAALNRGEPAAVAFALKRHRKAKAFAATTKFK